MIEENELELIYADFSDLVLIQSVLEAAPDYYRNVEGVTTVPDAAQQLLNEIPNGCHYDQKKVFLIYWKRQAIGVIDFILNFPQQGIGFLGLLLLDQSYQNKGWGAKSYYLLETFAKKHSMQSIQLGIADSNPVDQFWERLGFSPIGREGIYQGKMKKITIKVWDKQV